MSTEPLTADQLAAAYEPLPDDYLAIVLRDDQRIPKWQKLADPSRVLWDRHVVLAEALRLRAEVVRLRDQLAALSRLAERTIGTTNMALAAMPAVCKYHGANLDPPDSGYPRDACCDTGEPALRRRDAVEANRGLHEALLK